MTIRSTITMKIRTTLAALSLGALACNPSLGDMTESGGEETGNTSSPTSGGSNSGGGFEPCSAANPCPDGQFCFNGLCAVGCNSDGDCADGQYCATDGDRLCHNAEVTTCPDVPCADGQICVNGFCSTPPADTSCMPASVDDGCEKNAVCLEQEEGMPKCYTFPYCPQDGVCPVGAQGAVCNDGLLADKDQICLVGACTAVEHCPADWSCVKLEGSVIGFCSSGVAGSPCDTNDQCMSNNCSIPIPGFPGICA